MPLIEIHRRDSTVNNFQKMLESSCWRRLAASVAFIQLTLFLLLTLLLLSACVIQGYTGAAPYQNEIFHSIRAGILITTLHRDIMEAHNFGIFGQPIDIQKSLENGNIQPGVSISTDLKTELEDADWGILFTIFLFAAIISANQCLSAANLLRASLKYQNPKKALLLMDSWRISIASSRNYIIGILISTLLFATEVPGIFPVFLSILWLTLCLISGCSYAYYKQLSVVVSPLDTEIIDDV